MAPEVFHLSPTGFGVGRSVVSALAMLRPRLRLRYLSRRLVRALWKVLAFLGSSLPLESFGDIGIKDGLGVKVAKGSVHWRMHRERTTKDSSKHDR